MFLQMAIFDTIRVLAGVFYFCHRNIHGGRLKRQIVFGIPFCLKHFCSVVLRVDYSPYGKTAPYPKSRDRALSLDECICPTRVSRGRVPGLCRCAHHTPIPLTPYARFGVLLRCCFSLCQLIAYADYSLVTQEPTRTIHVYANAATQGQSIPNP